MFNLKEKELRQLQLIGFTPPGFPDPSLPIAASRAGGIGVLDLEFTNNLRIVLNAISTLGEHAKHTFGVKLSLQDEDFTEAIVEQLPKNIKVVILASYAPEKLSKHIEALHGSSRFVVLEATSIEDAEIGQILGVDALLIKGNEAAGFVGEKTSFVLLQQIISKITIPSWIQGGIGVHNAAACYTAGASGIVLGSQLTLTKESPLSDAVKKRIGRMDGTETVCLGGRTIRCRVYHKHGFGIDTELLEFDRLSENDPSKKQKALFLWYEYIQKHLSWDEDPSSIWLLGQDAAFAALLARKYVTVGSIFEAIRQSLGDHISLAKSFNILGEGAPLARSHGTRFPIVQGPMARVSDKAEFALQVAEAGGLPFIAASQLSGDKLKEVLHETNKLLGDRPWGVGLLGFAENNLFQSQIKALDSYRPRYAILAGGLPDQVAALEAKGILTYAHIPSASILEMFVNGKVRRFIFEGRECGGHIGPRSSFVLWEEMIEKLSETLKANHEPEEFHILFAGGIHDALSAAMLASMAAPLVKLGVRIGLLCGTAYLFTNEIVETGAIVKGFQKNAVACLETHVLEVGVGHAIRCCKTPFVRFFEDEKYKLTSQKLSSDQVHSVLEKLVLGRLQLASKGVLHNPEYHDRPDSPPVVAVDEKRQNTEGLYMIGQIGALRDKTMAINELHNDIAVKSCDLLASLGPVEYRTNQRKKASDIAVIGMSCLLPKARRLQEYWENILEKVNVITEIPSDRWNWGLYFSEDQKARDKIYCKWGGFLDDVPFDPLQYGIPPNSIRFIEPLHLLTLEVVNEALKDAGYGNREFPRERTSVIFGTGGGFGDLGQNYVTRASLPIFFKSIPQGVLETLPEWTEDSFPGILMNVLAGRVANRFNLGGVNYTIDAACASSLAALYDAVRELESESSDMVIIGGVDASQSPFTYLSFSKTQALSPRGKCQVFDEKADGTVLSEGLAVLVLKRLTDAERDGDRIYAVIKSVEGSSDGRATGLTAPRVEGQLAAMRKAYEKAGFSAATVELLEAHGTGTILGDQVEAESATDLLKESNAASQSCAIGSVKSMIGHTKGAAGISGVIKAVLSLYHKVLSPTLGVDQPNPKIDFLKGPLYVNTEVRPWIGTKIHPRRAGVSSFGFGGTNFHAVFEEYEDSSGKDRVSIRAQWPCEIFVWAANSRDELVSSLSSTRRALEGGALPQLGDLAFALNKNFSDKKNDHALTLSVVAASLDDLKEKITFVHHSLRDTGCSNISNPKGIYFSEAPLGKSGKVAFLFPGQGSQYPNMLREMAVLFPEVRHAFEHADSALSADFPERLSSYIFPPPRFSIDDINGKKKILAQTNIAQPALGATCYGMFKLFESLHFSPEMVAGHSYGEYVALCVSGVFDEKTLYEVSAARGRLMVEAAAGHDLGTMAAVKAGVSELRDLLKGIKGVVVANINAPKQTVISGEKAAVSKAVELLKSKGMDAKSIPVAGGFHSPSVAPAKKLFSEYLSNIEFAPPHVEVFSNTFASPYGRIPQEIESCLAEHMVRPVEFLNEIEAMYEKGARIFVEVGPGSVLTNLTGQILEGRPHLALSTDASGSPALPQLLQTLGQLIAHGVHLSLNRLYEGRSLKSIDLKVLGREKQKELSPATWFVNGTRARPAGQATSLKEIHKAPSGEERTKERVLAVEQKPDRIPSASSSGVSMRQISQRPEEPAATEKRHGRVENKTPRFGTDTPIDEVMVQFQQLMSRFLDTQKSIMMAYLQDGSLLPASASGNHLDLTQDRGGARQENLSRDHERINPAEGDGRSTVKKEESTVNVEPRDQKGFDESRLCEELLRITGERTGYPKEMLSLDADMEAELGIDSIKRVEILAAFMECFPEKEKQKIQGIVGKLSKLKVLRRVIQRSLDVLSGGNLESVPQDSKQISSDQVSPSNEEIKTDEEVEKDPPRFSIEPVEAPIPEGKLEIRDGGTFVITDDGNGVAEILSSKLEGLGGRTIILKMESGVTKGADGVYPLDLTNPVAVDSLISEIRMKYGPVVGLVHLLPLGHTIPQEKINLDTWRNYLKIELKSLFYLGRALSADLREAGRKNYAWLVAATGLSKLDAEDGISFGGQAGTTGFVKTMALEWPDVKCLAIHLDLNSPPAVLTKQLLTEMASAENQVELEYRNEKRTIYKPKKAPIDECTTEGIQIKPDWVILITGGAVGISAEIASEIAAKYQPILLLVGRSPFPEEEGRDTAGLTAEKDIKAALIEKLRRNNDTLTPTKVEAAYKRILKNREIHRNVEEMRKTGATVQYLQTDVRDETAFGNLIDGIYRSFGRLDGIIHGAGIIEDKLLEDKTPESIDRVLDTKVDSSFILSKKIRAESLKFIVFFASVAGCFGNIGQSDYAAANEVLNSLALYLDTKWNSRVVAINWGPWKGTGMVSPEIERQFNKRGIQVIPAQAGRRKFDQELRFGRKGEVEVVIGDGPWMT